VNEHGNIDFSQLITLGLITADEASQLTPTMTTGMMRDYAISWAQQTVYKMWENGHMISTESYHLFRLFDPLRGACADFCDMYANDQPNTWTAIMLVTTNILLLVVVLGFPLRLLIYTETGDVTCFQWWIIITVFAILFTYRMSLSMVTMLRNPWTKRTTYGGYDMLRIDVLIAQSERQMFATLRASYGPHMFMKSK